VKQVLKKYTVREILMKYYKEVMMSKITIRLFAITATLTFSACTTVQDVNYKMYKTRIQAQSYLTGKKLKPLANPRARIRRISNRNQQYCPPTNNRRAKKVIKRPAYKVRSVARKQKRHVRRAAKAVYRAKPVARRYVAPRKAKAAYRPRPAVAVRRPVVAPRRAAQVRRPVVAPRRVAQVPKPAAPRMPLNQLNDGLFNAAKGGNVAQINSLLGQGAQVNAKNSSGETALHAAAALGRAGAVGVLLQKGANPNARTSGGWTPLHSAARFRHAQVARLLIGRGASVNVRNNQGKTPMALAEQVGARSTASTLMRLGGR